MREFGTPARVSVPDDANLTDLVDERAVQHPHGVLFSRRHGTQWRDVTASEWRAEVFATAAGLVAWGLQPGDRVALMSRTRYEWTLLDFAIWCAGGVTVPIYETSSQEQVEWILADSGAVAVVAETAGHAETVAAARASCPTVREVWTIDAGAVDTLVALGRDTGEGVVEQRRRSYGADALATLIYTSGTTGRPKGVELTHRNLLFDARNSVAALDLLFTIPDASTLMFLPLAHVFARIIEVATIAAGIRVGHTADVTQLVPDLQSFRPTFILSVPRVFEKVYNAAHQKAVAEGRGRVFDAATRTAIAYSEALERGGPSAALRVRHALFDRLVYGKLRAAMGGNVRWAVSGGAALGARLGHFFRGIGVTVLEGYGLTETSAAATVNLPDQTRIGSVGRPLPGCTIRIADDGEVLIRGDMVMTGYWANPQATADALDADGWFHSGDIGELDADGFLRITGRKKELIVTAGGKNVAPAVLEDRLRAHWLVSQAIAVGDGRPFVAALVTVDPESFPKWKQQAGKAEHLSVADLAGDPDLLAEVQKAVDDANAAVSRAEAIRKFAVLGVDFTEAGGQLTPTMKVKRNVVLREFGDDVESLYR